MAILARSAPSCLTVVRDGDTIWQRGVSSKPTPDDVLDGYPVDRLMHDIALALMAVQTQTTSILDEFPTKAAQTETAKTQTEAASEEIPLF